MRPSSISLKPVCARRPDPAQLRRGIEVEHEHTTSASVAERIARHHLCEFPDYYTRLDRMEAQAKAAQRRRKAGR